MTSKEQGAQLRALARESYAELLDFAEERIGSMKGDKDLRAAAETLVSEITSEVAAETAAETAAEAAAQMGVEAAYLRKG